jgi:zinc protease
MIYHSLTKQPRLRGDNQPYWHYLLLIFIFLFVSSISYADVKWPHSDSDIPPDPAVIWGALPNGMRYALLPNNTPPDRISMRFYIKAGSLMEKPDQRGIAHFLEHLAFKGSENLPVGELIHYLQRLGIGLGADSNASTSYDFTSYELELPSNSHDMLQKGLMVFREFADKLLIPDEEIEKERGVILSEKRASDTPGYRASKVMLEFLLPETLMPQRPVIGVDSVIKTATREQFLDFYRSYYVPERMILVIVGAIGSPKTLVSMIENQFGSLVQPASPRGEPDLGKLPPRGLDAKLYQESGLSTQVSIRIVKPFIKKPDTVANLTAVLYRIMAHNIMSERLRPLISKENAPFSGTQIDTDELFHFVESSRFVLTTTPADWERALAMGEQLLRQALRYGFTQAEVDAEKKRVISLLEDFVQTAPTRYSSRLADTLQTSLHEETVFVHPEAFLEIVQKIFAQLTPDHLHNAFKQVWDSDDVLLFVSGDVDIDNGKEAIIAAWQASQKVAVKPPFEKEVPAFAYRFGDAGKVVAQSYDKDLDIYQYRFDNNVRLNLKSTDFEANTIDIEVRFGAGRLTYPLDKPGIETLFDIGFIEGGLEGHSAEDLKRLFIDRIGVGGISAAFVSDAMTLVATTSPQDLADQLKLMATYITAPGYRIEGERACRQYVELAKLAERRPTGAYLMRVPRFLHEGDQRFGLDFDNAVKRSMQDLRVWLAKPLRESYLEMSLVGDFNPAEVVPLVAKTFGSLPKRAALKEAYEAEREVSFPKTPQVKIFEYSTDDPKAIVSVYWRTVDASDVKLRRQLLVLSEVLLNRLTEKLRDEAGATYSPAANHSPSYTFTDYGYLYADIEIEPAKAIEFSQRICGIADDMQREGITQDELDRALKPVISHVKENLVSNSYWFDVLSQSQEKPETLVAAKTFLSDYESISLDDINRVARQYLKLDNALRVVVVPDDE